MIKRNSTFNSLIFLGLLLLTSCRADLDSERLKNLDEETIKQENLVDLDKDKALKNTSEYYVQQKKDNYQQPYIKHLLP